MSLVEFVSVVIRQQCHKLGGSQHYSHRTVSTSSRHVSAPQLIIAQNGGMRSVVVNPHGLHPSARRSA